ncbi:MAG: hypothetical protein ACR2K5_12420 [Pseudolabrys sp.]
MAQEIKDTKDTREPKKRPENLRANVMPKDGFVLSVDRKLKARYDTAEQAMAAGVKLKQSFPVVEVAVYDATARAYTPVTAVEAPAKV